MVDDKSYKTKYLANNGKNLLAPQIGIIGLEKQRL